MAVQSFSIEIKSINIYKFGSLISGAPPIADKSNSLNLMPQVHEITVYESMFSPIIKSEIAVIDYIGLFTNFPLTGEEIIIIEYNNVGDDLLRRWTFAIESITDITTDKSSRAVAFILNCVSIEALANVRTTVQKFYQGSGNQVARQIFDEHIIKPIQEFYPSYNAPNWLGEDNSTVDMGFVVPNMHPIAAIDMVQQLTYSTSPDKHTYLFWQNSEGFNFKTLQGLYKGNAARRQAMQNKYKYLSDEIPKGDGSTKMNNEERLITNLSFNQRQANMKRVATGGINNNLFEINIAQKAVHSTRATIDDIELLSTNQTGTTAFKEWINKIQEGDEKSSRTRYSVTTRQEHDTLFPVLMARDRWGKDLLARVALSQVDLTAVIPGTNRFKAGDLFYLEIPEFHGFNDVKQDDLISGMYIITDVKNIIRMGGFQSTVLRINKDSNNSSVDRDSRYK